MTREEAIAEIERLLDCAKKLQGPQTFVEFRPAPALEMALAALRPVSRERVEKVWRGEWKHYLPPLGAGDVQCRCTRCGRTPGVETPFCAWCGAPMTDEAVEITMQRLEVLYENHK